MLISFNTRRTLLRSLGLAIGLTAIGCGSNPLQPSSSTSIGTPQAVLPADGTQLRNADQPVTLTVQNATISGTGTPTYTFEVATDSSFTAFASKVQTKDGVAQGAGQTSVTLDPLAANTDYYWHARAQRGSATGPFSPTVKFTIGAAVTINAPTAVSPLNGAQTSTRPIFTVNNGSVQGSAGAITYKFEISTTNAFTSTVATGTVSAGASQTSFTPATDLPSTSTLFWRATGMDATNNITGTPSTAQSFTTGTPLWPGIQPPGTTGHAIQGNNWQTQTVISYTGVPFTSPTLDQRQLFDLMDRGMSPQAGIDWMHANGYPTAAAYFSSVNVIGYEFSYLALIKGQWDLVIRSGA
jgi:hypothetical protein